MTSKLSALNDGASFGSSSETLHCLPCRLIVDDEHTANVEQLMRISPLEHDDSFEDSRKTQRLETSFRGHSMIGEVISGVPKKVQVGLLDSSINCGNIIAIDNVVVWRENARDLDHAVDSISTCTELAFICKDIFS